MTAFLVIAGAFLGGVIAGTITIVVVVEWLSGSR